MSNVIYINKDPIICELDSSVDKESTKKMIAFKYFNSNLNLLEDYLNEFNHKEFNKSFEHKLLEPKTQLEFSF